MKTTEDDILLVYYGGNLYRFRKSRKHEFSWFGGPCEKYPSGIEHGPQPLHHVATLWRHHLPFLLEQYIPELPLFYGFCFDGCRLRYRVGDNEQSVTLLELEPTESAEDFPYQNYPGMFPYYPVAPLKPEPVSKETFLEMLHQPLEISSGDLMVLVPSQFTLGISLWGPNGDAEEVQVVFRIKTKERTVEGFNLCT